MMTMLIIFIIMIIQMILISSSTLTTSSSSISTTSSTSTLYKSLSMMTFGNTMMSLLSSSSNDNTDCKDGVCSIDGKDKSKSTGKSAKDIFKSKILDLQSKGISELEKKIKTDENFIPINTNTETTDNISTTNVDDTIPDTDTTSNSNTIPDTTSHSNTIPDTPTNSNNNITTISDDDISDKVSELVKMGWKKEEAQDALKKTDYDVSLAAVKLEEEQEENQKILGLVTELEGKGWLSEASDSAIRQCNGNITEAIAMLEKEENIIIMEFDAAVKGMLENGWEEVVARQALLAQWTIDQRKAIGVNTTIPADVLASIKPTLKKIKEDEDTSSNVKTKQVPKGQSKGASQQGQPKRANKEDCVFDVTAANFQKLVLESPVPVLLDIYADWCGPCKQLGPILEEAAMKSGGMFRLAKVNSDNERAISETLRVQGLPTVFSVSKGKVNDRFVGMLPQEQLQQFLVRTITGYGDRVQKNEVTDSMMDDATKEISQLAGLALLDFKKREKIRSMINAALDLPGGADDQGNLSNGAKISMKYIANVGKDIRNPKFRIINTTTTIFSEEVASNECAMQLLDIVGFKKNDTKSADVIELAHYNSAVITIVLNKVTDACQQKKFQKVKATAEIGPSKSLRSKSSETSTKAPAVSINKDTVKESISSKPKEVKIVNKPSKGEVIMSVRLSDGSAIKQNIKTSMKLDEALTLLLKDTSDVDWKKIEVRHPKRMTITRQSTELDSSIKTLEFNEGFAIVVISNELTTSTTTTSTSLPPKAKKIIKRKKGGTHTLLSTGITSAKKKKNNEYFGGDSTVTQAGEEDEDDDEDEEIDDKKKN